MRIVNYKRFIISVLLILLIFAVSFNVVFSMVAPQAVTVEYLDHIVVSGETVWEIAREYCFEDDIRDFVFTIAQANQLDNYKIYPGQILIIPVK